MKKRNKGIAVLIALITAFSAAAMTGCVGIGGGEVEGKANIHVGIRSSELSSFRLLKTEYEKSSPEVNLVADTFTDYYTAMRGYVKNGNWPDVVWTTGDKHASLSGAGHFLNLKELDAADDTFDFAASGIYDVLLSSSHYSPSDDGYWFMPRDYNVPTIIVNKTHFEKAGLDFDEIKANWNEEKFFEVCAALKTAYAAADSGNVENIRAGFVGTSYPVELDSVSLSNFQGILRSMGGRLIDPGKTDMADICAFDSDESLQAFTEFYNRFYAAKYVDPADTNQSLFQKRAAGMVLASRPLLAELDASKTPYDFLPNPFAQAGVGCGGYAITAKAATKEYNGKKNSDYAWDFLKYVVSEAGQEVAGRTGLIVPCLSSMADSGSWTEYGGENLNHAAFTSGYTGTTFSLNDINVFKNSGISNVEEELISLVTYCIQYSGASSGFLTGITEEARKVYTNVSKYALYNA